MKFPKENEIYEHYKKKNLYQIITVAEEVDTLTPYVIYKRIPNNDDDIVEDKRIWARTAKEFIEDIEIDGKMIPRFKRINP